MPGTGLLELFTVCLIIQLLLFLMEELFVFVFVFIIAYFKNIFSLKMNQIDALEVYFYYEESI